MTQKIDKSEDNKILTAGRVHISFNEIEELQKELKCQVTVNEANPTYEEYLSIATLHNKLGKIYFYQCNYKKAITHYEKVLDYKDKAGHYTTDQLGVQLGIADTYEKLSEVYRNNFDSEKAEEYKEQAIRTRKKAINALIE